MKNGRHKLYKLISLILVAPFGPIPRPSYSADISTDGTVGSLQSCTGSCTIPQSWGTTRGNNLFHSFGTFNVSQVAR
ncbi:hypothetical protein TI05_01775 [Achromatium sp. WMS3]|nr:hypothetical protein TI05_01775 [Achromatium sp. WMS3]